MDKLPHDANGPRIVLGYDNQIKLMVNQTNEEKWTKADFEQLEKCKIQYLEERIGYKIPKLSDTISHDKYEDQLESSTTFFNKEKSHVT